ncbi:MAG: CDP-diacylglycerol--serine O-phosphatidyltransferase [Pseudomonadales bacterium]|nr:CDP-diacylglycerol--serine O-phosphatidyltransferase [Pseudomonadales bacterium]
MDDKPNSGSKAEAEAPDEAVDSTESLEQLIPVDEFIEEEIAEGGHRVRHRGVYLLPNLFTTAGLFAGFYAIVSSVNGQFEMAAIAIFVAMVLDGLDGRVARMTNTQSAFGAEYDSLCDMVSFGVAPALVMFNWSLSGLGKLGWAAAFVYVACAALRLARFNTQIESADCRYFTGVASPAAAAIIASLVWCGVDMGLTPDQITTPAAMLLALITLVAGISMVLNLKYHSFKGLGAEGRVPFVVMIGVVLLFFLITIDPPRVLLGIFGLYALSGPVFAVYRRIKSA